MSLKKLFLIAALVALAMPATALADGITFGFVGTLPGHTNTQHLMNAVQPISSAVIIGSTAHATGARLEYVSRFSGSAIPAGGVIPPQILQPYGSMANLLPNLFDFGLFSWLSGAAVSSSATSVTYDGSGSSLVITGNGSLPGTGAVLFSGSFVGTTTLAQTGPPKNPNCTSCNFWYTLSGSVSGTIDPGLMALLGLGNSTTGNGLFYSLVVGFVGPKDTVGNIEGGNISLVTLSAVPEPGTLALFGTGLIAAAGFVRRRSKV